MNSARTGDADESPVWSLTNLARMPSTIFGLQQKLYHKAKQEPGFRFYSLFGLILRRDVLQAAWDRVAANNGSPGVDKISIAEVEDRPSGVENLLNSIELDLRSKSYRPAAVRRVMIPKANGKLRPLGIPTVRDRVVQTAVKIIIEPIFEADFLECSHGYRPDRSAHGALREVIGNVKEGRSEVYDADLSSYFDTIPHDKLMLAVERRIADRSVLSLLRLWLKAEVEERDEHGGPPKRTRTTAGTPQGGVISPLLANLYLHWFDKLFHRADGPRWWANARLVRFADDLTIHAKYIGDRITSWVEETLEGRFGLTINRSKTSIRRLSPQNNETLDFLGYRTWYAPDQFGRKTRYLTAQPSPKAMAAERENLRKIVCREMSWLPITQLIDRVNRQTAGWAVYHSLGRPAGCFARINTFIVGRLYRHLRRRSQRPYRPPAGVNWWPHLTNDLGLVLLKNPTAKARC